LKASSKSCVTALAAFRILKQVQFIVSIGFAMTQFILSLNINMSIYTYLDPVNPQKILFLDKFY